jgi:hypothetical protein
MDPLPKSGLPQALIKAVGQIQAGMNYTGPGLSTLGFAWPLDGGARVSGVRLAI